MAFNTNQFNQQSVPGELDLSVGGVSTAFTVRIDPDSSASDIEPGTGLQVVDGGANDANGVPLVDVLTANTQTPFGALVYNTKKGQAQPGEIVNVSWKGTIQKMEAAGALNRWAAVSLDIANAGQVKAVGTDATFGRLLDKASAAGDIVRVLVDTADAPTP